MYKNILESIRTREELSKLNDEVELLQSSLFESGERGFESVISSRVRAWVAREMRNEIEKTGSDKKAYLEKLKQTLSKYTSVKITLAFEPTDITIDKIFAFLKKSVPGRVVVEFDYEPPILGGATITYKGKYYDLTLKRVFDKEFESHQKDLIAQIYKKVSAQTK